MNEVWSRSSRGMEKKDEYPPNNSWNKRALEVDAYRCITCGWMTTISDQAAQSHSKRTGHTVVFTPAGELP